MYDYHGYCHGLLGLVGKGYLSQAKMPATLVFLATSSKTPRFDVYSY